MQLPEYYQSKAEEHLRARWKRISEVFQYFKMRQISKLLTLRAYTFLHYSDHIQGKGGGV